MGSIWQVEVKVAVRKADAGRWNWSVYAEGSRVRHGHCATRCAAYKAAGSAASGVRRELRGELRSLLAA